MFPTLAELERQNERASSPRSWDLPPDSLFTVPLREGMFGADAFIYTTPSPLKLSASTHLPSKDLPLLSSMSMMQLEQEQQAQQQQLLRVLRKWQQQQQDQVGTVVQPPVPLPVHHTEPHPELQHQQPEALPAESTAMAMDETEDVAMDEGAVKQRPHPPTPPSPPLLELSCSQPRASAFHTPRPKAAVAVTPSRPPAVRKPNRSTKRKAAKEVAPTSAGKTAAVPSPASLPLAPSAKKLRQAVAATTAAAPATTATAAKVTATATASAAAPSVVGEGPHRYPKPGKQLPYRVKGAKVEYWEKKNKFYEVSTLGTTLHTRAGKLSQTKRLVNADDGSIHFLKTYGTAEECGLAAWALLAKKEKEGYAKKPPPVLVEAEEDSNAPSHWVYLKSSDTWYTQRTPHVFTTHTPQIIHAQVRH
jgi:predicted DNA-binding WGR domain protein